MDFIVIGAGRSGTTTLFNHLKQNPAIFIPPQKEIPIGDMPVDEYLETYFSSAGDRVKGTITPQYMAYDYAKKLHGYWPDAKIIALLRHPYERARSHHQQRTRRQQGIGAVGVIAVAILWRPVVSKNSLTSCVVSPQ